MKKYIFLMSAVVFIICIAAIFFIFAKPVLGAVRLEYTLKPVSREDGTIDINIRILRNSRFAPESFTLAAGGFSPDGTVCTDNEGRKVLFDIKDNQLVIGPASAESKYLDFSYRVEIGGFSGSAYQGIHKDGSIAFSGENALYLPYYAAADEKSVISKITLTADTGSGIKSMLPYKNSSTDTDRAEIKKPGWRALYNLAKSCYAFGNFDNKVIKTKNGNLNILLDPEFKADLPEDTAGIISSLYDYYSELFESPLNDYDILILPANPSDGKTTFAGVGGSSLGISLNNGSGADIKTFSHTLYSAFFDNKIHIENIHYQPNLWLYKGLASYYEALSLESLPEGIKSRFGFDGAGEFRDMYTRYIYFRLKEPTLYQLSPADEKSALQGQLQFYFYTEAPLIIKNIEDMASADFNKNKALLSYLLKHKDDREISVSDLMLWAVGSNEQIFRNYLSGETILPYSGILSGLEDPAGIINKLNSYERLLCSWNQREFPIYPYDDINLLDPEKLADAVLKEDVKFAPEDTEKMVGAFSPTVFMLLKQYKLRADVCGLKDINDPMLKYKLLNDEVNINKWNEYLKTSGLDVKVKRN